MKIKIICLFVVILAFFLLLGCDEKAKPKYYSKVYRENSDGSLTEWKVMGVGKIKTDGPLVCWKVANGGLFCISGKLTLVPIKMKDYSPKPVEKKK